MLIIACLLLGSNGEIVWLGFTLKAFCQLRCGKNRSYCFPYELSLRSYCFPSVALFQEHLFLLPLPLGPI